MKKIGLLYYLIIFVIINLFSIFEVKANYVPGAFNSWVQNTPYSTTNMPSGYMKYTSQASNDNGFKLLRYNNNWNDGWGSGYWINSWDAVWSMPYQSSGLTDAYVKNFGTNQYMTIVTSTSLGGATSKFGFLKTSTSPINISSLSGGTTNVNTNTSVNINITLSGSKCAEEYVLIRYTIDNWSTSNFITATGSGTSYSATIPGQSSTCTIQWYALTSTLATPSTDTDYLTLSFKNNGGSNYSYTVISPIYVNQITTGRPNSTYYLGDKLSNPWYFNFEINQASWNSSQVGIGQNADGSTGWSWDIANWYQDNGSNKDVRRDLANFQFTNTGTWYLVGRAKTNSSDPWSYADESASTNETTLTCSTSTGNCPYFTVNSLNTPSSQTATATSNTQINLTWSKDAQNHNVMIVRYPSASYTAPTNGTAYSVGNSIGAGTVVYNSNGTSFNDTGLTLGTTYYYVFYSENYSYYSAGVNANATTLSTLYFRSKANGAWNSTSTWEQSTDNTNWIAATSVPNSSASSIIVTSGNMVTISSAVTSPASANFIVNGTLEIQGGASVSTAPTYGANSTLKYNTGGNITTSTEWTANASTLGAGCPQNVEVTSGRLKMTNASFANKYYAIGNLTVRNGAIFDMDIRYDSDVGNHQGKVIVQFTGDITIETGGKIEYAGENTSLAGNLAFQCHTMTNNGILSLSDNTSSFLQSIGGDLKLTGNFVNNGTFNCNGRAIIFIGTENQQINGTTSSPFAIDFMAMDKSSGTVTMYKDVTCKGYSSNGGGWWALNITGGTLDLNGNALIISASDGTGSIGSSGINCSGTGKIKGSPTSSISLLGNRSTWSINNNHIVLDQTTQGSTNALKDLIINRTDSATLVDHVYVNTVHIHNSLQIKASEVTIDAVTLDSAAIGSLSSSVSTAKLNITSNLLFTRSLNNASEFYANGRTLTISGTAHSKVHFARLGKWHFISFPYDVTIKKSDNSTAATIGTSGADGDLAVYWYDPAKRATNVSGWTQLTTGGSTLTAGKAYIIAKRNTFEDLYFNPTSSVQGGNNFFTTPQTIAVTYTSAAVSCNAGWNFVAQPISVASLPTLTDGEFAYNYNAANDQYKLYFYEYNPGYSYTGGSIKPFSSVFVKSAAAGNVSFGSSTPQGIIRKKVSTENPESIIPLRLNVNNIEYETLIRVKTEATTAQDELYDAPYSTPMSSSSPRLYSLIDGVSYSLNSIPEGNTIPIGLRVPASGTYTFSWDTPTNGLQPTLTDSQGATTDMTTNTSYEFSTSVSGDINTRFLITVPKRVVTNIDVTNKSEYKIHTENNKITIEGLNISSKTQLFDITGKLIHSKYVINSTDFEVSNKGIYILQISNKNGVQSLKIVVH